MPETSFSRQMILKLGNSGSSTGDQARANQPKNWFKLFFFSLYFLDFWNMGNHPKIISEEEKDDLNAADDGESSEESHGASDETQLGLSLDLLVPLDLVVGGRVKEDLH